MITDESGFRHPHPRDGVDGLLGSPTARRGRRAPTGRPVICARAQLTCRVNLGSTPIAVGGPAGLDEHGGGGDWEGAAPARSPRTSRARRRPRESGRTRTVTWPTPGRCRARRSRRRTCRACGRPGCSSWRGSRGWHAPLWFADGRAGRAGRRRVPARPGRQRVRADAGHREAAVGVPGEPEGDKRPRARRGGSQGRDGVRRHADLGLCAQRRHRQDDLGGQRPASQRPGGVRDPAAGGRRAGLPGQRARAGARRRGTDGARCGQRSPVVEFQHGHPAVPGRAGSRPRLGRRLGDTAGGQRRLGYVRHREPLPDDRLGDQVPVTPALHRQRGEPGRRDREAALVLPGRARRLHRQRPAGIAGLSVDTGPP